MIALIMMLLFFCQAQAFVEENLLPTSLSDETLDYQPVRPFEMESDDRQDEFFNWYELFRQYTDMHNIKVALKEYQNVCEEVSEADEMACLNYIVQREEDDYRKMVSLLTINQAQVLRAIAKEKIVEAPTSTAFLKKYNLPAMSSVKRVIDFLKEKEYIYHTSEGYIIYDRFMAIWLQRMY